MNRLEAVTFARVATEVVGIAAEAGGQFREHIAEILHELRLPKDPKLSSREQAEEAAYMLKEKTSVEWEVECA